MMRGHTGVATTSLLYTFHPAPLHLRFKDRRSFLQDVILHLTQDCFVGCLSSGKHDARSQATCTHIVPYAVYQCWMAVAAMCAPFHRRGMTSEPSSLTPGIVGARASFRPTARSRAPRRSTENFPTADPCLALEGSIASM